MQPDFSCSWCCSPLSLPEGDSQLFFRLRVSLAGESPRASAATASLPRGWEVLEECAVESLLRTAALCSRREAAARQNARLAEPPPLTSAEAHLLPSKKGRESRSEGKGKLLRNLVRRRGGLGNPFLRQAERSPGGEVNFPACGKESAYAHASFSVRNSSRLQTGRGFRARDRLPPQLGESQPQLPTETAGLQRFRPEPFLSCTPQEWGGSALYFSFALDERHRCAVGPMECISEM